MSARKLITIKALLAFVLGLLSAATALPQTYKNFRVGRYEGQVYNKTGNGYGKAQFDILSIGANGAVRIHLREYEGLEGEGTLTGAINDKGVLQARGGLISPSDKTVWQSDLVAIIQNGNLRFGQKLILNGKLQEESATMAYKGATMAATPQPARTAPANAGGGIRNGIYLRPSYDATEAFYFGSNGQIVNYMREGFTQAGLAAHDPVYRGTYRLNGNKLQMTTASNRTVEYAYKVSNGRYYLNDLPLEPVLTVTDPTVLVGEYFANGGYGSISTASTLSLRGDGSYTRGGVGSYRSGSEGYGGSSDETGTWQYANHTITFRAQNGTVTQKIALLPSKNSMSAALGALYMGGIFYRQKK